MKEVQRRGKRVAMVGDGVNERACAVDRRRRNCDWGPEPTSPWRPPTLSCAKLILGTWPALSRSAGRTYRKMIQNLWWAAGYNIVAIPLAAAVPAPWGVVLPAAVGAVLMSLEYRHCRDQCPTPSPCPIVRCGIPRSWTRVLPGFRRSEPPDRPSRWYCRRFFVGTGPAKGHRLR